MSPKRERETERDDETEEGGGEREYETEEDRLSER